MKIARLSSFLPALALAGASATAAWYSAEYSWVAFLAKADPERALASDPANGAALVARVTGDIERDQGFVPGKLDAKMAVASLVDRPLNEGVLRILGSVGETEGRKALAAQAMLLSDRASRRDVLAQLWLIEYAVQRDDLKSAVAHYHNVLSIRAEMASVLFPVLASALVYEDVRSALQPYIRKGVVWMPSFLTFAAANAPAPAVAAMVRPVAASLKDIAYNPAKAMLLHRLFAAGDTSSAVSLSQAFWPDVDARVFSDFGISPASRDTRLGLLGWNFPQTEGVSSSVESDGTISASISPLARGTVAQRDVAVIPGRQYRLIQRVRQNESGANADLRWAAACVYTDHTVAVWGEALPPSTDVSTLLTAIPIPATCSLVRFTLTARGPDGQTAASVTVADIRLSTL